MRRNNMVKVTSMPKETLAELIHYIAENEKFSSVASQLESSFTVPQVRAALRELAEELSREAAEEGCCAVGELRSSAELSSKTKDVISSLSPQEERRLLSAFGLISE
jgi:hypothetical protein